MFKQFFIIFCLVVLIISCQPTEIPELTDAQRQAIANEIRQIYQDMMERAKNINEETFNKGLEMVVESNDESWLGNPAIWVSRLQIIPTKEEMDKLWRPIIGRRASDEREMMDDYVAVLSPNHAIHVLKAKSILTSREGNIIENLMTATTVYVKRNGEWKILHYHQSFMRAPQETQTEKEAEK